MTLREQLRAAVLAARDLTRIEEPVPEWGVTLTLRELDLPERARYYRESLGLDAVRDKAAETLREKKGEPKGKPGDDLDGGSGPAPEGDDLDSPVKEPVPEEEAAPADDVPAFLLAQGHLAALALRLSAIDPGTGEQLFGDEDLPALEHRKPEVMERLHLKIARMSGIGIAAEDDLEGNSVGTLSAAPSSSSASPSERPPESSPKA